MGRIKLHKNGNIIDGIHRANENQNNIPQFINSASLNSIEIDNNNNINIINTESNNQIPLNNNIPNNIIRIQARRNVNINNNERLSDNIENIGDDPME